MTQKQITPQRGIIKEQVLRVLLNHPKGALSKYKIWKNTEGSQTWVYDYLNQLEEEGYIQDTKVTKINELFQYWKKHKTKPIEKTYLIQNPMKLLEKTQRTYALTTYRAENLIQNHLFPSRTDIYCHLEDQEYWHKHLTSKGLVGGGNFRTLYTSKHVFYNAQKINNYQTVSTPQLIIDLLMEGGPAVEAAEILTDKMVNRTV
jgi:tRNA splicing endonuclease